MGLMKSKQNRMKELFRKNGIQGAIVSSPENFHYVTGFGGHQHTVSRQPGFSVAVLSAEEQTQSYAITMDFEAPRFRQRETEFLVRPYDTWVGVRQWKEITGEKEVPPQADFRSSMDVLVESVKELGLENQTVGIELDYLPVPYYQELVGQFPHATFVNISDLFVLARSVKTPEEIEIFRQLCKVADLAFYEVSKIAQIGITEQELVDCFRFYVNKNEKDICDGFRCIPSGWSMFSTGPNGSFLTLPQNRVAKNGDVIKFDAGVNADFDFYTTDTSRGWIIGEGDSTLVKLKQRLYAAQRKMIASAKPGLPINELFKIGFEYVQAEFPAYRRGHLGHSISLGPATAENPYINATETRPLEAGMVLAMEVPCYIDGVNGFNIEDMVLITETGSEVLTSMTPHFLEK